MSLMEKLAQIAQQGIEPEITQEEYAIGIQKVAGYALGVIAEHVEKDTAMSKEAEESMTKLSAEDRAEILTHVHYGRGIARGEAIGKQAGYVEGSNDSLNLFCKIAEQIYGEEVANELYLGYLKVAGVDENDIEQEQSVEQVKADITEAAAAQLIEAAGGEDNISPEQAEEFKQIAETAGELGVQKLMEGEGGEGDEGGEGEAPQE